MYPEKDNRYHTRTPIDTAVVMALPYPRDERVHGTAVNLSRGGMFVRAEQPPLSVDEPLELSFAVDVDGARTSVYINCRVVHVNEQGTGLEFDFVEAEERTALEKLVQGELPLARASSTINRECSLHPRIPS